MVFLLRYLTPCHQSFLTFRTLNHLRSAPRAPPKSFQRVQGGLMFNQVNNILSEVQQKNKPCNKSVRARPISQSTTTEIHLSKIDFPTRKIVTYLYAHWNGTFPLPPPPTDEGTTVPMSGYSIYDTVGDFNDLVIFDKNDKQMIVGKVSTRKAKNHSSYHHKTRQLMADIPAVKPKAKRGKKTNGVSKHHSFFSKCFDQQSC